MDNGAHFDGDQSGTVMVSRRRGAAPDAKSPQTAGIQVWPLGHAEGGEGRELPASPDRGSG
ncbi:host specificity J domain protein [Escherichia coli 2853500]|nr:host specificity J domain protein [Escherichia coli 2853500]